MSAPYLPLTSSEGEKGQQSHYTIPHSHEVVVVSSPRPSPSPRELGSSRARRLGRVFAFALFTVMAFHVAGAFFRGGFWAPHFSPEPTHDHHNGPCADDWQIPPHLTIEECEQWPDHPSASSSPLSHTFEIPVTSDLIFLLSRGPLANGNVQVVQSDEVSDNVKIQVTTDYEDLGILRNVKVCQLKSRANENELGVGIFTHRRGLPRHRHVHLTFDVLVTLPQGRDDLLYINSFESRMPLFSHTISDLAGNVAFDKFTIKSAVSPLFAQSLYGEVVTFETAQGSIEGSFNASRSLRLMTANAHISANVSLYNIYPGPVELTLKTANAPIRGNISLFSVEETGGGNFRIDSDTAQASLSLDVLTAPVDSTLTLGAHSANGPVRVRLDKTYEGAFKLSTALASAQVTYDENAEDPAGRGRHREVEFEAYNSWNVRGTTKWSEEGRWRGRVDLATALGNVELIL